jgi:thiamine-phosphate pyrophosphorylase
VAADKLEGRRLYLCTPDRRDLESFVRACITCGVDVVQLREKELDAKPLLERARLARHVCQDHGVPFILNDRPDLALEVEADGVHVGQDDAPPSLARRLLGPDAIVGLSTHAPNELDDALEEPVVDYLSAGPVSQTPTKPGRPGTGLRYLTYVVERAKTPWFVTGGVTPDSVKMMTAAGARRFVVVRYLTEAEDPKAAAKTLREAIKKAVGAA